MKNTFLILLLCLVGSLKGFSQTYCEFDSVYYATFYREDGCRVIKTSDGNFVTLSISGLNGIMKSNIPTFMLTKLNVCGELIWRKPYDSCYNCVAGVSDLIEEENGNILFSGYFGNSGTFSNSTVKGKSIRLIKVSKSGELLWSANIGDSTKKNKIIKSLKVSENRYLFVGSYFRENNSTIGTMVLISDTLGNTLFQDSSTKEGEYYSVSKTSNKSLLLLGREDTSMFILQIDSNGINLSRNTFPYIRNIRPYFFLSNTDGTRLFYFASNSMSQTLIAHLDLNGNLIKDSLYNPSSLLPPKLNEKSIINPSYNNSFILPGGKFITIDSNLQVNYMKWFDSNTLIKRESNFTLITPDSSIVSVGRGNFHTFGIGNAVNDYWFGVIGKSTLAKAITINGADKITKNHGSIQLSAIVLPNSTFNKAVFWEVNDISKASITQTGLLTAKENGIVTITATSLDGTNIKAQKNITLSNSVGIFENTLNSFEIYPNPASTNIQIKVPNSKIIKTSISDMSGKVIYEKLNSSEIDLGAYPNGLYLIMVETDLGIAYKKLLLNK